MFREKGELAAVRGPAPPLPDPDDAEFPQGAEVAQAEYLAAARLD